MNCNIKDCKFSYYSAEDYNDYYEEEEHCKYHGCCCNWKFEQNRNHIGGQDFCDGWNRREQVVNCPFHQVMF
jgi:hypothetical protein